MVRNVSFAVQTDSMPINQWRYNATLAKLCGPDVPLQPDWMQNSCSTTTTNILGHPDSFRDDWGPEEIAVYELADQFCQDMLKTCTERKGPVTFGRHAWFSQCTKSRRHK